MELKVTPIQSASNYKPNTTTSKEELKKKSPVSFKEILKNAMKQ